MRRQTSGLVPFWAFLACLLFASVAFRWPALINAAAVDSDSAVVGLQAMHLLSGEVSPFLWGSGYQTSVDSFVAAAFFVVFGATPLALMLSTFVGHLVLLTLAYATLGKRVGHGLAAVLVLPLVFTPSPLHTYILGPPRQASLTLVFLSVWLLDGSARSTWPHRRYALGSAVALFACYADPYALVFLPALGLLALLASLDDAGTTGAKGALHRGVGSRLRACSVGALAGLLPLVWLWTRPSSVHGELGLTRATITHNLHLLVSPCLPWILSATAFVPRASAGYTPWHPSLFIRGVEMGGAALFLLAVVSAVPFAFVRKIPWEVRRLGLVGTLVLPLTIAGFLASVMVMDLFSTRYLAAIVLASPLAMAPLAYVLGSGSFAAILLPYTVSAALAGWLGFGPNVREFLPLRTDTGQGVFERNVVAELGRRGVHYAVADYWISYRMTFLSREELVVVPIHAREDRYASYRDAVERAPRVAYVFDAQRSRESWGREPGEPTELHGRFVEESRFVEGTLAVVILRRVGES